MSFSSFDPVTKELLFGVYEAAWRLLSTTGRLPASEPARVRARQQLTRQLVAAADSGERDFERLKAKAIEEL